MAYTGIFAIRQKTYEGFSEPQERLLGVFVSQTKAVKALQSLAMQFLQKHPDAIMEEEKCFDTYFSFKHGEDYFLHTGLIIDHYNNNVIVNQTF